MDVRLPQLAEGVESGTVVNILVSEGQEIQKDQAFMELETQKAVGSIPSPASGTVSKIHVKEGMEVSVGQVLISISAETGQAEAVDFSQWGPVRRDKMSALRRTVSRRMVESWTTIPKINQFDEADITSLLALRKTHASAYGKKGAHLTLTSFLLKAVAAALQKHPRANASVDETTHEIVFKDYFHIGVAVD